MKIKFWGCRGSIPVPDKRMIKYGGNTCCAELDLDGKLLIIDAGTGIRKLGEDLIKREVRDMDIFITHSHWDHIQGFPFFAPIYRANTNINILGCTNSYQHFKDIFANQMSIEYFPVRFSDLKSNINFSDLSESEYKLNGYSLKTLQTNHPTFTFALKVEKNGKSFVFITDNELESEKASKNREDFAVFSRNATYLIHDSQFTEDEYIHRRGWGHSTFEQSIALARDAGAENLGFFHHDPARKDKELDELQKKLKIRCKKEKYKFDVFTVHEMQELKLT